MSKIAYIIRPITNGMYNDTYTVYYTNGTRRRYTINGAMNKKHFEFIQNATVEAFYSKWTGAHKHDIFRPAPAEEPTAEEPTAEEPTQEGQTMTASREFFTLEEKTRKADNHHNIVADSDTEYTVKNAPTTEAAVKLAMIKYATKLESIGTPAAALLASTVRDYIRFEYFTAENGYNYSGQGGGAFEISVDYLDDTTTAVYLRVAEILEEGEEPAADQAEETSENYIAWCGMIESDVITDEFETLSEAIDEVETRYTKEEMKAAGITFCKLLCNENSWLECLDEKTVDDVYYF